MLAHQVGLSWIANHKSAEPDLLPDSGTVWLSSMGYTTFLEVIQPMAIPMIFLNMTPQKWRGLQLFPMGKSHRHALGTASGVWLLAFMYLVARPRLVFRMK